MIHVYPVVFAPVETGFVVDVPDLDVATQGDDLAEAIYMARDLLGIMGTLYEDEGKEIPVPSNIYDINCEEGSFITLVDVDFDEFRREHPNMKNMTYLTFNIDSQLKERAEKLFDLEWALDVMFKQVVKKGDIIFKDFEDDPFFSKENLKHLEEPDINMAQVRVVMDGNIMAKVENLCIDLGLSIDKAISILFKQCLLNGDVLFDDFDDDPFYSEENQESLRQEIEKCEEHIRKMRGIVVDEPLKAQADKLFDELDLDIKDVITSFLQQCVKIGKVLVIDTNYPHKTFKERMEGYEGDYKFEEWDTGKPVGEEIF